MRRSQIALAALVAVAGVGVVDARHASISRRAFDFGVSLCASCAPPMPPQVYRRAQRAEWRQRQIKGK